MNRIIAKFARLKSAGKKGLIVYIGAGDPNLAATRDLALAFDKSGVDVLELGVPFSDPLADGVVNQLAAQRGLESGTTPPKLLETVAAIRKQSQIPIVLYIYFNLIHKVGLDVGLGKLESRRAAVHDHTHPAAVGFAPRRDAEQLSKAACHAAIMLKNRVPVNLSADFTDSADSFSNYHSAKICVICGLS